MSIGTHARKSHMPWRRLGAYGTSGASPLSITPASTGIPRSKATEFSDCSMPTPVALLEHRPCPSHLRQLALMRGKAACLGADLVPMELMERRRCSSPASIGTHEAKPPNSATAQCLRLWHFWSIAPVHHTCVNRPRGKAACLGADLVPMELMERRRCSSPASIGTHEAKPPNSATA